MSLIHDVLIKTNTERDGNLIGGQSGRSGHVVLMGLMCCAFVLLFVGLVASVMKGRFVYRVMTNDEVYAEAVSCLHSKGAPVAVTRGDAVIRINCIIGEAEK
jgi:hypothetical protein